MMNLSSDILLTSWGKWVILSFAITGRGGSGVRERQRVAIFLMIQMQMVGCEICGREDMKNLRARDSST
jgi:hypothetical protein